MCSFFFFFSLCMCVFLSTSVYDLVFLCSLCCFLDPFSKQKRNEKRLVHSFEHIKHIRKQIRWVLLNMEIMFCNLVEQLVVHSWRKRKPYRIEGGVSLQLRLVFLTKELEEWISISLVHHLDDRVYDTSKVANRNWQKCINGVVNSSFCWISE